MRGTLHPSTRPASIWHFFPLPSWDQIPCLKSASPGFAADCAPVVLLPFPVFAESDQLDNVLKCRAFAGPPELALTPDSCSL